jgi:hypothetical protein
MINKLNLTFVMILFSCLLVSAIYPGETKEYEINIGTNDLSWVIVGNTTDSIPIINIINDTFVNITIPTDIAPCDCSIVFLKNDKVITEIPVYISSGGGGSSRTITKYVNNTKEVPNYISVENKTIEYVENKTIEKEIVETNIPKWWVVGLGILLVGIIIGLLFFIMKRFDYTDERRDEEYEYEEENK